MDELKLTTVTELTKANINSIRKAAEVLLSIEPPLLIEAADLLNLVKFHFVVGQEEFKEAIKKTDEKIKAYKEKKDAASAGKKASRGSD